MKVPSQPLHRKQLGDAAWKPGRGRVGRAVCCRVGCSVVLGLLCAGLLGCQTSARRDLLKFHAYWRGIEGAGAIDAQQVALAAEAFFSTSGAQFLVCSLANEQNEWRDSAAILASVLLEQIETGRPRGKNREMLLLLTDPTALAAIAEIAHHSPHDVTRKELQFYLRRRATVNRGGEEQSWTFLGSDGLSCATCGAMLEFAQQGQDRVGKPIRLLGGNAGCSHAWQRTAVPDGLAVPDLVVENLSDQPVCFLVVPRRTSATCTFAGEWRMLANVPPESYVPPHQSVSLMLKKVDFATGGWFAVYSLPHLRYHTPDDRSSEPADNAVVEADLVKVISFSAPENGKTLELQIGMDSTGALTVGIQ